MQLGWPIYFKLSFRPATDDLIWGQLSSWTLLGKLVANRHRDLLQISMVTNILYIWFEGDILHLDASCIRKQKSRHMNSTQKVVTQKYRTMHGLYAAMSAALLQSH